MVALHTAGWTRFFQKLPPLLLAWPSEPLECVPSAFPCLPGAPHRQAGSLRSFPACASCTSRASGFSAHLAPLPSQPLPLAAPWTPAASRPSCPRAPNLRARTPLLPLPHSYPHSLHPTARLTGRPSCLCCSLPSSPASSAQPLPQAPPWFSASGSSSTWLPVWFCSNKLVAARRGFVQTQYGGCQAWFCPNTDQI